MPQHIVRLIALLVIFAATAVAAKIYFTDDSFYRYGHYRGDYPAIEAAAKPKFRGPAYCQGCHTERHVQWTAGVHKVVKCEICHTPAGDHPATTVKLPIPADTVKLCTLCHEKMPSRPATQPQIVVKDHPYPHEDRLECITCHNPHAPSIGGLKPAAALAVECAGCHGADGKGVGAFPGLLGKDAAYLAAEMKKYKAGARQNPMMTPIIQVLSDRDIDVLAEYYATLGDKSAAAPAAPDAESAAVVQLTAKCIGCHGAGGQGAGEFPPLAGKDAAYLIDQLKNYKSGVRQNPMMVPIAKGLTDEQIEMLGKYYATLGAGSAAAPGAPSATAPAVNAKCVGCHGAEGQGVGAFPALAGKETAYLIDQLHNYKSGARDNPMMTPLAKGLTDEEIEKLAGYYSALKASN
jgi:cytochrome c553